MFNNLIDHLSTYSANFSSSKSFYSSALKALNYEIQSDFVAEWNKDFPTQRMCAFGPKGKSIFWLIEVKAASVLGEYARHFAFAASSRDAVVDFYAVGLKNGGVDNDNGEPDLRARYHGHYFGAFLIDPDGNNIEAVCHRADAI